ENLGPMTRDELREAIVKPAETLHVGFEPGLVDAILDDVERRPGSLPLLQFALREMWGRVEEWRGGFRLDLSVSAPFVWRCLSGLAVAPFPHSAHR
ncbi:MAG TPA: hypothetical protein VK466_17650, partial [Terriglobales bacterium]|nr:hypothetical protein [Terriglobales bacterium]